MLNELIILLINLILICSLLYLAKFWNKLSKFFYTHPAYFNIFFILLYTYEQAMFIIIKAIFTTLNQDILSALFALIVLTTVSLHIYSIEIRYKQLAQGFDNLTNENFKTTKEMQMEYNFQINNQNNYIKELEDNNFKLIAYIKEQDKTIRDIFKERKFKKLK